MPDWATHPITAHAMQLAMSYRPDRCAKPLKLALIRDISGRTRMPLTPWHLGHCDDAGWTYWTGTMPKIYWVQAGHLEVLKTPHVEETAQYLRMAMDEHYAQE